MTKPTPKNEPAAYIGLAVTVLVAAAGQLLHLSDAQWRPLLDAAPLVAGLAARFFVTPAGRSVADQITAALADANSRQVEAQHDLDELRALAGAILPAPVVVTAPVSAPVAVPVSVPVRAPVTAPVDVPAPVPVDVAPPAQPAV